MKHVNPHGNIHKQLILFCIAFGDKKSNAYLCKRNQGVLITAHPYKAKEQRIVKRKKRKEKMSMIRCMAIDDEPLALRQIVAYIGKIPFLELAAQCQSALQAREFLENDTVDAIFCDINMPDLSGMDFVKSLASPPLVVFTTAYSEYAVEGFKVNAVDYLLKPFGLQEFQRAADRLRERLALKAPQPADNESTGEEATAEADDIIFIKSDYRILKVSIADIRYVEAMSEYLKVWLDSQPKPIITLLSMKKMEERLPAHFMRIHRSYIVNLNKIKEVNKNRVFMDEQTPLPIGDMYKEAFQAFVDTKFLGKC